MSLTVMTYNLRFASDQPPNSWPQRRPVAGAALRAAAPDIVGTQEGLAPQIRDLAADHLEYGSIGIGRDSDGGGETATIFYRRERLSVVEQGHFWLSDTPETAGSTSWGNVLPRMSSWARFRDHDTDRELYLVNTHLDNDAAVARTKGAELICARVDRFDPDLPVIVTGDFNAISRADPTYDVFLAAGFTDLRFAARDDHGPTYDSYHGYRTPGPGGAHIDWILGRGPIDAVSFRLIDIEVGGQYPSDHFPLAVTLELLG